MDLELRICYGEDADIADLERAIQCGEDAVKLVPPHYSDIACYFSNLSLY